jgi:hypothetical protein
MKKVIYCTYFDKGFLLKGLALHASLIKYNPDAKLWILAFDKYTEDILKKMRLKGVTVIGLGDFEDEELLKVKPTRKTIEYYWTSTPSLILYIMKKNPGFDYVVYLDADVYFFSDPDAAISEIGSKSLFVVEHRFPKGYEGMLANGRFNVAFNVFKNNEVGIKTLARWRKQCIEWCYATPKDGKLGDQTYLDEWPVLYRKDLVISKNVGVDAAPWNISQYKILARNDSIFINSHRLVCYHFHQFQILGPSKFSRVHGFTLPKKTDEIYRPYETEISKQYKKMIEKDPSFVIDKPSGFSSQILRQRLAKYLGPAYWRIKSLLK